MSTTRRSERKSSVLGAPKTTPKSRSRLKIIYYGAAAKPTNTKCVCVLHYIERQVTVLFSNQMGKQSQNDGKVKEYPLLGYQVQPEGKFH